MRNAVLLSLIDVLDCLRAVGDPEKLSAFDDCRECRGVRGDEGMLSATRAISPLGPRSVRVQQPHECCGFLKDTKECRFFSAVNLVNPVEL